MNIKRDDPSVSGSHCEILLGNGNAVIRDLGSKNGTFGGQRGIENFLTELAAWPMFPAN
jgi:pSer/pThr/pTyr-binding forkhead associated (FHA) protein